MDRSVRQIKTWSVIHIDGPQNLLSLGKICRVFFCNSSSDPMGVLTRSEGGHINSSYGQRFFLDFKQ